MLGPFWGLFGYYHKFIPRYAKIVEPLFSLTKKERIFIWTPIYQGTFVTLKRCLIANPVLTKLDFSQPFVINVDWSIREVGVIMSQKFEK
jgi:hypothetical protein